MVGIMLVGINEFLVSMLRLKSKNKSRPVGRLFISHIHKTNTHNIILDTLSIKNDVSTQKVIKM